jgi:hypothetical protein
VILGGSYFAGLGVSNWYCTKRWAELFGGIEVSEPTGLGQYRKQAGAVESPFGLKTGLELRVCKPPGVVASLIQDSKWKFRL